MNHLPKTAQPVWLRKTNIRLADKISIIWRLHTRASSTQAPDAVGWSEVTLLPRLIMHMTLILGVGESEEASSWIS